MAGKRAKRFDDGGVVGNSNYPFGQGQATSTAPASTGLGNMSPLVQVNTPGAQAEETTEASKPFGMKKGGKAKGYAKGGVTRADGCVAKGHTKGKMV